MRLTFKDSLQIGQHTICIHMITMSTQKLRTTLGSWAHACVVQFNYAHPLRLYVVDTRAIRPQTRLYCRPSITIIRKAYFNTSFGAQVRELTHARTLARTRILFWPHTRPGAKSFWAPHRRDVCKVKDNMFVTQPCALSCV